MSEDYNTRVVSGRVVSDKAEKTISVHVERRVQHELYGKYVKRSSRIRAHDEDNSAGIGDTVEIVECAPYSKRKAWRLVRVVEKSDELGAAG